MFRKPFNFQQWINDNQHHLVPPVSNKHLFDVETNMVIMVIGGPNQRTDYHDDPVEEFFYQVRGDMVLKLLDNGEFYDVPIREGEVFYLPPHVRHSPQRPVPGSVGLVVEGNRREQEKDGFEWFCFSCGALVHRVELVIKDIVKDLPPLFNAFYDNVEARRCPACDTVHPDAAAPTGWVKLGVD